MNIFKPESVSNKKLYFRLLSYVRPYWKAFLVAVLGMVGSAATEPVFPAIMKYLLDHGFRTEDDYLHWLIPLGVVVLFIFRAFFSFITNYLMIWVSQRLVADLRRQLFAKMLTLPTQAYLDHSPAKMSSRILFEVGNVSEAVTNILVTTIRESLTALTLLAYLFYLDWQLTIITLFIGPLIALLIRGFSRRMRAASRLSIESFRVMSHTIDEAIQANKVIKIFSGQTKLINRFNGDAERFRNSLMREAVPTSATSPITHMTASVAVAIIIWVALTNTTGQAGESAGGFVSFITAMLLLISPIKQLSTVNTTLQRGLAASEGVFGLLDMVPEDDSGQLILSAPKGGIEFDHVFFSYPESERQALCNLSFKVQPGQTVALVGASGGGKTTIAALLPRFYFPDSGKILIDGVNINLLSLQSLRHSIAMVSQDIVLFNDTVEANISFGSSEVFNRGDIIAAAKAANAWEFISQLPQGMDTLIGDDGAKLSGGQRQRVAIARALLKNAPILILDEATSALDAESERSVQAALTNLMSGRTTLVIAHRLSTIERADQILVLDQGQIVESGTHEELLSKGTYYANLHRNQV